MSLFVKGGPHANSRCHPMQRRPRQGADKPSVAVVGYDVCHLQDRKNVYKRHHVPRRENGMLVMCRGIELLEFRNVMMCMMCWKDAVTTCYFQPTGTPFCKCATPAAVFQALSRSNNFENNGVQLFWGRPDFQILRFHTFPFFEPFLFRRLHVQQKNWVLIQASFEKVISLASIGQASHHVQKSIKFQYPKDVNCF